MHILSYWSSGFHCSFPNSAGITGISYLFDGMMGFCWQEYIRDLEKKDEEEKRLQKVPFRASLISLCVHWSDL